MSAIACMPFAKVPHDAILQKQACAHSLSGRRAANDPSFHRLMSIPMRRKNWEIFEKGVSATV